MLFVRPTIRGIVITFASIVAIGTAFVNVNIVTNLIAAILTAILFASFLLAFFSLHKITLYRRGSPDGTMNAKVTMPVTVINNSKRHRQAVVIREKLEFINKPIYNVAVSSLAPKEKRIVNRRIKAFKRGHYKLDKISLIGGDPAGLFYREKRFNFPDEITIYPENVRLSWMPIRIRKQTQAAASGRPLSASGLGQEFFGVREYRPSDGVRFIHWKASAKHKKLMVREFEAHSSTQVNIILDVDKKNIGMDEFENNFEYLVKTVTSMVTYLAGMYCKILFVTAEGSKANIVTIKGDAFGAQQRITLLLSTLTPCNVNFNDLIDSSLDILAPNSIFYCLTLSEPKELHKRFDILLERGVDIRWIYAPKKYFPWQIENLTPIAQERKLEEPSYFGVTPYIARRNLSVAKMLTYG